MGNTPRAEIRSIRSKLSSGNGLYGSDGTPYLYSSPYVAAPDLPWVLDELASADTRFTSSGDDSWAGSRPKHERLKSVDPKLVSKGEGLGSGRDVVRQAFGYDDAPDETHARFSYPSAGGLYGVQALLLENSNDAGLHVSHFLPLANCFEFVTYVDYNSFDRSVGDARWGRSNDNEFWVAYVIVPDLAIAKYGFRGYKLALMEVGAMYQSSTLVAQRLQFQTRVLANFDEIGLASILGLNPANTWVECLQMFRPISPSRSDLL